jgi:NADH-quinone oxidoreductase subunit D
MEELCGARLTYNYMRIGGVMADLPPGFDRRVLRWLDHFEPMIDEFNRTASSNKIYIERLANLGIVSKEMAIAWGLVGPNLRASGVKFDVRKNIPYSVYPEFDFEVPVGQGWVRHRRRHVRSLLRARARAEAELPHPPPGPRGHAGG